MRRRAAAILWAICLGCCLLLGVQRKAQAGAWNEPQGSWLDINTLSYYSVPVRGYNQLGQPAGNGTYKQIELSPYIEYGLTPDWTLGVQPRLQEVIQSGLPYTASAFGLVQFNSFARYQIYRGDHDAFSVQGQIDIGGVQTGLVPQVAETNTEYELRLLYGHGFELKDGWTGFINVEGAYRFETQGWADQVRADVTLGLRPRQDWMLLLQSFNTIAATAASPGQPQYNLFRVEASVVHDLNDHVAIQFGAWHDAGGYHIALGNAGIVALWLRF
jgi:protein XagA